MSDSKEKFHVYDGIIEHDNPLPTWWLWTFFLTIIFSFIYYLHYEIAGGPTLEQELQVAMADLEKHQAIAAKSSPLETEDSLAAAFSEDGIMDIGKQQFQMKCASCHGPELGGLIGPNLTDKYWLHGGGHRLDIVKMIREGVPEKGMPPWGPVMKKEEIYAVAAFIYASKGSSPANVKAPEGEPEQE